MASVTHPVVLRTAQAETYDALALLVRQIERDPTNATVDRLNRIDTLGIDLRHLCRDLESALTAEDNRLRSEGTTDQLDDRWIKNLRRLEVMLALLNRAELAVIRAQTEARA